jgi:hypothetical protein
VREAWVTFASGITIAGQKAGPYSLVPRDKHGFIVCAYALLEAVPDSKPSKKENNLVDRKQHAIGRHDFTQAIVMILWLNVGARGRF